MGRGSCPNVKQPLCATNGEQYLYFENPCQFEEKNYQELIQGRQEYIPCSLNLCQLQCPPCLNVYSPVCAVNLHTNQVENFSNSCEVDRKICLTKNNYRIVSSGNCNQNYKQNSNQNYNQNLNQNLNHNSYQNLNLNPNQNSNQNSNPTPKCPQFCTLEFNPVCAKLNNELRQFPNNCQLQRSICENNIREWQIVPLEVCNNINNIKNINGLTEPLKPKCPTVCTLEFKPVCASYNNELKEFPNNCELQKTRCETNIDWRFESAGPCFTTPKNTINNVFVVPQTSAITPQTYSPPQTSPPLKPTVQPQPTPSLYTLPQSSPLPQPYPPLQTSPQPSSTPKPCPSFCTREFNPICVRYNNDIREFSNNCELQRSICETNIQWQIINVGPCISDEYNINVPAVCATNGREQKTFQNLIQLQLESRRTGVDWTLLHTGICKPTTIIPPCYSTPIYITTTTEKTTPYITSPDTPTPFVDDEDILLTTTTTPLTTITTEVTTTTPDLTTTSSPITTEDPITTTIDPITTTVDSITTIEDPITTTEDPITTTEDPITTTSADPITSTTPDSLTTTTPDSLTTTTPDSLTTTTPDSLTTTTPDSLTTTTPELTTISTTIEDSTSTSTEIPYEPTTTTISYVYNPSAYPGSSEEGGESSEESNEEGYKYHNCEKYSEESNESVSSGSSSSSEEDSSSSSNESSGSCENCQTNCETNGLYKSNNENNDVAAYKYGSVESSAGSFSYKTEEGTNEISGYGDSYQNYKASSVNYDNSNENVANKYHESSNNYATGSAVDQKDDHTSSMYNSYSEEQTTEEPSLYSTEEIPTDSQVYHALIAKADEDAETILSNTVLETIKNATTSYPSYDEIESHSNYNYSQDASNSKPKKGEIYNGVVYKAPVYDAPTYNFIYTSPNNPVFSQFYGNSPGFNANHPVPSNLPGNQAGYIPYNPNPTGNQNQVLKQGNSQYPSSYAVPVQSYSLGFQPANDPYNPIPTERQNQLTDQENSQHPSSYNVPAPSYHSINQPAYASYNTNPLVNQNQAFDQSHFLHTRSYEAEYNPAAPKFTFNPLHFLPYSTSTHNTYGAPMPYQLPFNANYPKQPIESSTTPPTKQPQFYHPLPTAPTTYGANYPNNNQQSTESSPAPPTNQPQLYHPLPTAPIPYKIPFATNYLQNNQQPIQAPVPPTNQTQLYDPLPSKNPELSNSSDSPNNQPQFYPPSPESIQGLAHNALPYQSPQPPQSPQIYPPNYPYFLTSQLPQTPAIYSNTPNPLLSNTFNGLPVPRHNHQPNIPHIFPSYKFILHKRSPQQNSTTTPVLSSPPVPFNTIYTPDTTYNATLINQILETIKKISTKY